MGVPKLLVKSKLNLRHLIFKIAQIELRVNSVPRNKGVPKLLVESKRDLR